MIPSMTDPDIDEVLAIREELSAEFDHSPAKLVAYLMEIARKDPLQERYIRTTGTSIEPPPLAAVEAT